MMQKHSFEAIGTEWLVETLAEIPEDVKQKIADRIEEFDQTYSRFRKDSLVEQMRQPGKYVFPEDSQEIVEFYRGLYDATGGAVTPLVGGVLEAAGYDSDYSLKPSSAPVSSVPSWDDAMEWQGTRVTVRRPIVFDIGAAGKGYLVDCVAKILMSHNINEYTIDASGDICHRGETTDRVGLENPYNTETVLGVAQLRGARSLCASAGNRRAWNDWHHIVDPRTARPVHDVVASWVIADATMVADGLATALFFVPPTALPDWEFEAVRLMADGRLEYTPNFVGELFI